MKRSTVFALSSLFIGAAAICPSFAQAAKQAKLGALPLSFEPNRGQPEPSAQFLARGAGYYVTVNSTGSRVVLRTKEKAAEIDTHLLGSNPASRLTPGDALPGHSAWFRGSDRSKWISNIPNFAQVKANSVYPGIDLLYYGNQSKLEYDFVVAPGANPSKIRLRFDGVNGIRTDVHGNLILSTKAGELTQNKPVIYQEIAGARKPVDGAFAVKGRTVSFRVGEYDRSAPLTIDPVLVYSSYLGGSDDDYGNAVAADSSGNMYMTGTTYSTPNGDADVLMRKISSDGTAFIYNADLGGSEDDVGDGIAVDPNGYAYITGRTDSTDFPATANAFQTQNMGSTNAFVTCLDPNGDTAVNALVYSTFLGGSNDDEGYAIAIDSQYSAYVTGITSSSDFPYSQGAFQTGLAGNYDAFVTKFDKNGNFLYSTYIGGGSDDEAYAIAVDGSGNAYITGETNSDSFPQANASFQHSRHSGGNGYDAFVTIVNASGTGLNLSTFAGGSGDDAGNGIALDPSGNIYVVGTTASSDFPGTGNSFQSGYQGGNTDAFVLKYGPGGSNFAWASYLGSHGTDEGNAVAVDANGNIYIAGDTDSDQFPVTGDATQGHRVAYVDATLSVMDTNGTRLYFSTFYGGSGDDIFYGVAVDPGYNVYLTGLTSSPDLPIVPGNAVQPAFGGGDPNGNYSDALLAKISLYVSNVPGASSGTAPVVSTSAAKGAPAPAVFGRKIDPANRNPPAVNRLARARRTGRAASVDAVTGKTYSRPENHR